ncbi:MAG TPA: hypothetical protein VEV44_18335, partial [Pseudoneobacillus sp.]|nr:hypothetical protein [Pseudoneobacillus sp.]
LVSDIENRITTHFHCPINSPKLKDVLDEIEQFLLKEFAFICLYRRNKTIQYSDGLAGIEIDPLGWVNFTKLWCLE